MFSNALRSFATAVLAVTFPIYLSMIGVPTVLIGITFTGRSLFSAVQSLVEGVLADRIGRKPILLFIALMIVLGGAVFMLTTDPTVLVASTVLFSVGGAITYTPAELALLTEKVDSNSRTRVLSLNATFATVGSILGNFAAALPAALQALGLPTITAYQQIFLVLAGAGMLSFFLFLTIKESTPTSAKDSMDDVPDQEMDERRLLMKWSGVVALDQIGGSFNNLLSYWYYLRFGVGPAEIGLVTGIGRFIATVSFTLGYKMAKRLGTIRATVMSRVPIVLINYITPLMPSFTIVAATRVFMSVFSDIDIPLRQSYIMGVTRRNVRATAYGTIQVVSRFTSAGAPAITGYLYEFVSLSTPFFGAASFQLASAASMYILFKDIKPPEEKKTQ